MVRRVCTVRRGAGRQARWGFSALLAIVLFLSTGESFGSDAVPAKIGGRHDNVNVVLVSLQCLRPDHTGIGGYKRDTTPCLDELAKSSVVFDQSIAHANLTPIAMMAALTSQYPRVNGMVAFDVTKDAVPARTLPEVLKYYGYKTAAVLSSPEFFMRFDGESGKVIDLRDVFSRPFDDYIRTRRGAGSSPRVVPSESLDWIEKNKREKFFLWVASGSIHVPFASTVPPAERNIYDPPGYVPFWTKFFPVYGNEGAAEDPTWDILIRIWKGEYYQGFKPVHKLTPDDYAYIASRYDASVRYTDKFVGDLVGKLKREGLWEKTLFVVYSIHGDDLGERDTYLNYDLSETVVKNSLIVHFPGDQYGGRRVSDQVQGIDIMPTLLDYLDIPRGHDQQGITLLPLVRNDPGAKGSEYAFIDRLPWWEHWLSRYYLEFRFHDPQISNYPPSEKEAILAYGKMLKEQIPIDSYPPGDIAIRTNRWKLIHRKDPRRLEKVTWFGYITGKPLRSVDFELYDLVADPLERRNVIDENPAVVADLKARLLEWDASVEKRKASYVGTSEKRYIIPYP